MVSTRGGARTSAGDVVMAATKNTTRKTTTKSTATATSTASAKSTRTKKAVPQAKPAVLQMDDEDEDVDELAAAAPANVKSTRRGRSLVKKDDIEPQNAAAKGTTKATSAARTRATRTVIPAGVRANKKKVEETRASGLAAAKQTPDLKPTQSRATRPTRATAAKEKAAPLSPKKITQVLKPKVAHANSAVDKAKSTAKPATRARPATRRRNVSDENAEVPDLLLNERRKDEVPDAAASRLRNKRSFAVMMNHEENTLLSTRSTTPADSTQQTYDEMEDRPEELNKTEDENATHTEQSSDDELCGPKTPMRRCDRRDQHKYSPAKALQFTARIDIPVKTPVRRFQLLGTQQGTPQTQKPYCQPTVPMSELRPLTVARARTTAMVFPRLEPLPHSARLSSILTREDASHDSMPSHITKSWPDHEHRDSDVSLLVDDTMQDASVHDVQIDESHPEKFEQHEGATQAPTAFEGSAMWEAGSEEHSQMHEDSISEADRSVIVTAADSSSQSACSPDSPCPGPENAASQAQVQTIMWENLREDATIPFAFDGNVSPARTLPPAEPTERLSIAAVDLRVVSDGHGCAAADVSAGAPDVRIAFDPDLSVSRHSLTSLSDQLDDTVNVSEFVDITSITHAAVHDEPQSGEKCEVLQLESAKPPSNHAAVEDLFEDQTIVDGDMTLPCHEDIETSPAARTPLRLAIAEDVAEEKESVDGDLTLTIEDPQHHTEPGWSPIKLTTVEDISEEETSHIDGEMTLLLDMPPSPHSIKRSPVKLVVAEDFPEEHDIVDGDITLALNSPLPQPPMTPALVDREHNSEVTDLDMDELHTPRYARSTVASRRKSVSEGSQPRTSDGERRPIHTEPTTGAWFEKAGTSSDRWRSASRSRSRSRLASFAKSREPVVSTPQHGGERRPEMLAASEYEELLGESTGRTLQRGALSAEPASSVTSRKRKSFDNKDNEEKRLQTPQQAVSERFPILPPQASYEAQTARPAARFHTPRHQPHAQRSATAQKPTPLHRIALKGAATPVNAPARVAEETPGQVAMTPHPKLPLRGIVALVDVYTRDGACASQSFAMLLKRLGARTTKTFNEHVTHVVYKEGSPRLLQALIIHNKQVAEGRRGQEIHCVNSRWVNDCDSQGRRMPETDEEYTVELDDYQRTAKRRRKSMEPTSLLKTNEGTIIRDRKSSGGRVSIGRASMKNIFDDAEEGSMPDFADKENCEDGSEPATPAYLKEPSSLVQQTVPAKRVHKLELGAGADKRRRLTFADGLEF